MKKASPVIKGIIGLVILLGVLAGAMIMIVRYENSARVRDENTASPTATSSIAQCYTLTNSMVYNSGNPRRDAVLAKVIVDNKDSEALKTFLADYKRTKVLDEKSPLWQKANKEVPDAVELRPYLMTDAAGNLSVAPKSDPSKFDQAELDVPESIEASFAYVKVALVESKTGKITEETREYVIALNSNDSRHVVVFPVQKSDNVERDGFTVLQITPVC